MDFCVDVPENLEIDQIIDFLHDLKDEKQRNWRTLKIYVAGIRKDVNMHVLRHCFATHSIEHGMNIKTLQYLMGHSSVQTTMVYLHISDVPLEHAFSPLDKWEE